MKVTWLYLGHNMASLDDIYTREWFEHDFEHLQPEFDVVADSIIRQFRPTCVVDVGCGPGMVVRRLRELGVAADGIDGSSHAIDCAHEDVAEHLWQRDITKMDDLGPFDPDLLICTEVAEHLDEKHAAGLVALLCSAMCPIVMTAAPPGQDGHHHVNCQPKEYWLDLFANHGVIHDSDAHAQLSNRWSSLRRLSHMRNNLLVLR